MPNRMPKIERLSTGWKVELEIMGSTRRRSGSPAADMLVDRILKTKRLEALGAFTATSETRRGGSTVLDFSVAAARDEAVALAVRYPSGALSFHCPSLTERRAGGRGPTKLRFTIPVSGEPEQGLRRGPVSTALKVVVLKVLGAVADKALPVLAKRWEEVSWKRRSLHEGLLSVSAESLIKGVLPPLDLGRVGPSPQRNLLLIHGTFSNAAAAFSGLASTADSARRDLFTALRPIYGDRIFAFDHFTISRTPQENARMLLEALPDRPTLFDSVTHSRGGLVLRELVERRGSFGTLADRFQVGRAVLVASPNQGTPLASPSRFDKLVSWISNLLELFPDNPWTFAVDLVAEGIAWLAHRASGSLPGISAMDSNGSAIAELQADPCPPAEAYSALVANYEPERGWLRRMSDIGVDIFFNTANDLVVPTEGGWRVDPGEGSFIPGGRIGCFGRNGNLAATGNGAVAHTTFFSCPQTIDFLIRALSGQSQPLHPIDPGRNLPFLVRRGATETAVIGPPPPAKPSAREPVSADLPSTLVAAEAGPESSYEEVFHLAILPSDRASETADLLAAYRNARVIEKLGKRGGEAGELWRAIISTQERIRDYIDGKPHKTLPQGQELITFGHKLFQTLFPGEVRRLYDVARALQGGRRLNIVFTSMLDWIADKPWEFTFDPGRKNFLAVEDVNFIRNVLTAIPADRIAPRPTPLRILVVVAQPLGTASLSVDVETQGIRSGFQRLIDAHLAEVEVLLDASPGLLHRTLEAAAKPFDVLHFIGHGTYEKKSNMGFLVFENEGGGRQRVDSEVFRQIVCRRGIRLVFLNACETGTGGIADFNRGVAPSLVAGGVPAVVANQYSVLDSSATSFAQHFYWGLAQGHTIGDAARESRVAVNYNISGETIDWAVPVVYARNPSDVLCTPGSGSAFNEAAAAADRRARRRESFGRRKFGVWDVNRVIPSMDRILERLTQCQSIFAFENLSLSAPLGTWQRRQGKSSAYLRVDQVADRLKSKPDELGFEQLMCITSLPLRDAQTLNLDGYQSDDGRLSFVSTDGSLEKLHPPEFSVERLVANAVGWALVEAKVHYRGPKSCVSYYNGEKDIRYLAGPLGICGVCRNQSRDLGVLAAVESILRAFP